MYKVFLGFLFGILLILVVSRHVEFDVVLTDIIDRFDVVEPQQEITFCSYSCTQEQLNEILSSGVPGNCGYDQRCRFLFAIQEGISHICPNERCRFIVEDRFNDYLYPKSLMLRYSLLEEINVCEGDMGTFIEEFEFIEDSELDDFYSDLEFSEFCDFLMSDCSNYYSVKESFCLRTQRNYDFFESYVSNPIINSPVPDVTDEYLNLSPNLFSSHDLNNSFNSNERELILNELREEIEENKFDYSFKNPVSINVIENFFTNEEIFNFESLDDDYNYSVFKSTYLFFNKSNNLFELEEDFHFTFPIFLFSRIKACQLNSPSTNEVRSILGTYRDHDYDSFIRNGILLFFINHSGCSEFSDEIEALNNLLSISSEPGFYKLFTGNIPVGLNFIYLFDIKNDYLETYLFNNLNKGKYDDFSIDDKMILYTYLNDEI